MIQNINITGVNYEISDSSRKYITKKIGKLDKIIPRHAKKTAHADVKIHQINDDHGNKYQVDIQITLPEKVLTAGESAGNVLAAVDIVEVKLSQQLRKYKETSIPHIGKRKLLDRFKRSYEREK